MGLRRDGFRAMAAMGVLAAVVAVGASGLGVAGAAAPAAVAAPVEASSAKQETVLYAAPAAWIDIAPIPPAPAESDSAAVTRLFDIQHTIGLSEDEMFFRSVVEGRNANGMAGLGSISVTWDPDHERIIVHWVRLIRGDETITLEGKDRQFEVLRRESRLESAILDGRLTATLQIPGARPGDMLDFAYTRAGRDPLLQGHSDMIVTAESQTRLGRMRYLVRWPQQTALQLRNSTVKGVAESVSSDGWRTLVYDQGNFKADPLPVQAPARFLETGRFQYSTLPDWGAVADLMAPLYRAARTPTPESPIPALADAIGEAHADAKARALAALRLAQQEVRYFALSIGDGGLKPATADETWQRRLGDCKGKTVLLLALLDRLGIRAEPALVSLGSGELVRLRLPSISAFNHVLVRAEIDGAVYWLDPTGDDDVAKLEHIGAPSHRWALPLNARALEAIDTPVPDLPTSETLTRIDFSAGIAEEAPGELVAIYRGTSAQSMRRALKQRGERLLREQILDPKNMQFDRAFTPQSVTFTDDFENNQFTVRQIGRSRTHWVWDADVNRAEFGNSRGGLATRIRREGPYKDVPIANSFPDHSLSRFEYILPNGGRGFTVVGAQGAIASSARDVRVAMGIRDGKAVWERRIRSFAGEMSLAEHDAERRFNQNLMDQPFILRAPRGMPRPALD